MTSRPQTPTEPTGPLDIEQAEAALVEHYPRLVRLGYLMLPPGLGRHRRVLAAHALVQRALPRRPVPESAWRATVPLPAPRPASDGGEAPAPGAEAGAAAPPVGPGPSADPAYMWVRSRVVRGALAGERPRRAGRWRLRPLPLYTGALPRVFGLRLFPRSGGTDELALTQALSELSGAARAAVVLRGLEGMADADVRRLLETAGVPDPEAAVREAGTVSCPAGSRDQPLLGSVEYDACLLQARPTDMMRRRQHGRAALAAAVAVLVCGGLLGLPGDGWGPDGAAAPRYSRNAAAEKALDPDSLHRVSGDVWRAASRRDFSVWPARGSLTGDKALLRRALAVWARPGEDVTVSATRGTSAAPPAGAPQLLYADRVGGADVVLLHDGLRLARYAEPHGATEGGAALDLARTDLADAATAASVVLARDGSTVRHLTAPWVTKAATADLTDPEDTGRPVPTDDDGVTDATPGADGDPRDCSRQPGLLLTVQGGSGSYLYTDLGELTPVRLTAGKPGAPGEEPRDATGEAARAVLARGACGLRSMAGRGVRTVNIWRFARQRLPEDSGTAGWVCTRGGTWRGTGAQVRVSFLAPAKKPDAAVVPAVRKSGTPACGARDADVLSGALWKAESGTWYLLAAGSSRVTSVRATGDVREAVQGRSLAVRAEPGDRARLTARLSDGSTLHALRP